jgi:hypothetical protein
MAEPDEDARAALADDHREDVPDREIVIGLLADPGLPTQIARYLADTLPGQFARRVDSPPRLRLVVVSETLHRSGDGRGERLIDQVARRVREEGWDLAVCLTDLPVHTDGRPVVTEFSRQASAVVVSVPALNVLRPAAEALDIVATLLDEWLSGDGRDGRSVRELGKRSSDLHPARPEDDVDLRLTRSAGSLRVLAGMVRVNRPWRLVFGLRSALAAAVATAAFGLVSSPVWELSDAISTLRLWVATVISVTTIIAWLIINHGLWQHARSAEEHERRRIRLYNTATLATLATGVLVSYLVLFLGDLLTGWFVVVPKVLSSAIGRPAEFMDYVRLAWLVSSLATVGGALGSGLESTDSVRSATWGTRYGRSRARRERAERQGRKGGGQSH